MLYHNISEFVRHLVYHHTHNSFEHQHLPVHKSRHAQHQWCNKSPFEGKLARNHLLSLTLDWAISLVNDKMKVFAALRQA